jgi:hypothetical protein
MVSGQLHAPAALPPWKEAVVPIGLEPGGGGHSADLDAVARRKKKAPTENRIPVTQLVA